MHVMNFYELFSILQNEDEQERIEAKRSFCNLGKSVLETICAFSNEPGLGGGYILLGLTRNDLGDSRYSITGISDPDKLQNEIVSICRQSFNVPIRPFLEVVSCPEGLVLS